jgi:ATP/ADP translocase
MTLTTDAPTTTTSTAIERKGWILVGLLAVVMILFGLMAFFGGGPGRSTAITGSECCNGERFDTVAPWAYDYTGEIARYMATYMFATGVLALVLVLVPLRRREPWAWAVLWIVPLLFAVHGFALGSFPFDIAPLTLTTAGLLLMARPVFGSAGRRTS